MTHSMDFTVIDNLRTSASRGQHDHVIQETFAIGNELQNLQLHLLDIRARSYVACAQFVKALDTAITMQQLNPASALGYLCQGYIHMKQGRHIAASHVYDKALERVDKHDSLYETIQAAKTKAMQQGEKRKDSIRDFPMEINSRIIQQLFTCDQFDQQRQYVMVSWSWWHRIMASNQLEYDIRSNVPLDETSDMVIQSFNYTRSLGVFFCEAQMRQLFEKYHFECLTTFAFHTFNVYALGESFVALEGIKTQLTDLTLGYHGHGHISQPHGAYTLRLQYILEKCPNLRALYCLGMIDIPLMDKTYAKLQELRLDKVAGTVGNQHMMMIQQHLPGLEIFDMAIPKSLRPLTVNDTWLPCIRHLHYGDRFGIYLNGLDIKQVRCHGLVSLSIPYTNLFSLDDIAPFIIDHHVTLQVLPLKATLDTTQTRNMMDAIHNHQDIEFKRLQVLTVNILSTIDNIEPYSDFISWVIERAPYLRTVELDACLMSQPSIKALGKCRDLCATNFAIRNRQGHDDYDTLVAEFVEAHVDYMADKGGSRLQSINVQLQEPHPKLIDDIREMKCLTNLKLFTSNLASESFIKLFESLRQGCEGLVTLSIVNRCPMPNRVLYHIAVLSNLRSLTITGGIHDANTSILNLRRCRHLEHLDVACEIHEDIQSLLQECNPHLKIMAPNSFY